MKLNKKTILLSIAALLVVLQFIPIDRAVPEVPQEQDFLAANAVPAEMAKTIKAACYDCHSYQTTYPWYANVAPLSFFLQGHVNGGRDELNFSIWTTYPAKKAAHKLEECAEEVMERHMPMKSYTWLHTPAKLSDVQVSALSDWFQQFGQGLSSTE